MLVFALVIQDKRTAKRTLNKNLDLFMIYFLDECWAEEEITSSKEDRNTKGDPKK